MDLERHAIREAAQEEASSSVQAPEAAATVYSVHDETERATDQQFDKDGNVRQ